MSNMLEVAHGWLDKGVSVVHLKPRSKEPALVSMSQEPLHVKTCASGRARVLASESE